LIRRECNSCWRGTRPDSPKAEALGPLLSGRQITRRGFLAKVGQGLAAANVAAGLLKDAGAQQPHLVVPDPPGKKVGYAVVGLGQLAIYQILPAIAQCEKSKVVAWASGRADKANKLALRYGVDPKNTDGRLSLPLRAFQPGNDPSGNSDFLCGERDC
jgi:hypothetical protein